MNEQEKVVLTEEDCAQLFQIRCDRPISEILKRKDLRKNVRRFFEDIRADSKKSAKENHSDDPNQETFEALSNYYAMKHIKFTPRDAKVVRTNMVLLSKKLAEIQKRHSKKKGAVS